MDIAPIDPRDLKRFLDDSATARLRKYFSSGLFTGGRFERFGGGGDRLEAADRFDSADIVAVSLLSVRIPGRAALELIERGAALDDLLADIPKAVDLWSVDEGAVAPDSAAARLWQELVKLPGIDRVTANKLLARKRPHLIPVYDRVVKQALGRPRNDDWWRPLRSALATNPPLIDRLERLRRKSEVGSDISLLRILDASIWMKAHAAARSMIAPTR